MLKIELRCAAPDCRARKFINPDQIDPLTAYIGEEIKEFAISHHNQTRPIIKVNPGQVAPEMHGHGVFEVIDPEGQLISRLLVTSAGVTFWPRY